MNMIEAIRVSGLTLLPGAVTLSVHREFTSKMDQVLCTAAYPMQISLVDD